jgi:hypothetical protein
MSFGGKTQGYKFHPVLQGIASADLNDFLEKKTTHGINESELRCAVFEVAMLTMKLLNKACTGLYPNWLYKNYVEKVARGILNKTEHLIEISGQGLEWRRVLMLFYINFRIFPNNGVLTNRETEFADTQGIETRINQDHLDGTVVSEIIKELELTKDIERLWDTGHQETQKNIIQYYLKGLFPLMGKFFRGLYVVYSKDSYMEQLNTSLLSLKTEFLKILPVLRNKFNIQFSFDKEDLQGLTYELVAGTHSRDSRVANRGEITYNRNHDSEEIAYTTLGSVRDVCEEFLRGIDYSLLIAKNDFYKIKDLMDSKYFRKSPIFISKNNLEPWNKNEKCSSFILKEAHEAIEMVIKEQENLSPGHDHAYSTEYHIYVELMDIYQEMKIFYLSKPVDENIFLKFLQSSPGYANNFITFISRLVERYFGEITKKDAPDEKTAAENMDKTLIIFLQNEVIISIIQFFSKVVADCSSIRDSLYQSLTDKSKPDLVAAGEEMVSLFYFIMCHLQQLVINKTFMDSEYDLIVDRYEQLAEFFKNLCENNCQKFKEFLGTFVPKIKGLPQLNKAGHDLVYDAYMRIDRLMTTSEVWKRKSSTIHMKDQPEAFEAIMKWIRFITECVNGPCPHNQKRIFSHRTDIAVGILKRSIANVDSSIYFLRNQMCDLVDGLLEGGSKEITKHFASNFTFNEIFQIICSSIKRLYIYCWINGDLEAYKKLAGAAHQKYKEKMRAKKEKEKSLQGLLHQEMEFYILKEKKRHSNLQYYPSQGIKGQNEPKNTDIYFDPRIISQQIMDQMVIEDYETIIEMYLRNQNFSNHVILQSVFKLNNFMMQFAESVAGFKICLHNVFGLMVDRFGPRKVPIYILNKLGNYERKKTYEADQNIVLYMFLCKIISEIELLNPSTRKSSVFLFPLVPKSFFITKATKINFLKESNTNAMTMDMILNYECFDIEMKDNLEMFRNYPLLYRLTSDDVFFMIKYVLWAIAFALNLVLIIFYRRDREDSHISLTGRIILYTLASLILLMSLAFMSIWFFARYSQKLKIAAKKIKEINSIQSSRFSRWFDLYIYYTMIEQVYPVYFGFYIFSSLLGIFLHPFFYSLLLLTIVVLSTTLNYVVKAITTHLGQLLLTVVMMILVIYCYAILSAEFFFDKFSSNQPGAVYYNCTQMWDCVLYVFNYGLRSGGGIGEVTIGIDPLDNNSGPYVAKFVFDVAFFMMINVISLNIIFGIIVDTFAELREKSDQQGKRLSFRIGFGFELHGVHESENPLDEGRQRF